MTPLEALELLVSGLNRSAFNRMETAGLQAAIETIRKAITPESPKE